MAHLLVALSLLGAVFVSGSPTPQNQTPSSLVIGRYESVPGSDSNFAEFAKVFNLPEGASFSHGNIVEFGQDGNSYRVNFILGGSGHTINLWFDLGLPQPTVARGKPFEYVFALEGGESEPVLRGTYRETNGNENFTIEVSFNESGFNAKLTGDSMVAKLSFRRTSPARRGSVPSSSGVGTPVEAV